MTLRHMSIKQKLILTTMLTTCVALLLVTVVFVTYDLLTIWRTTGDDLVALAQIIGRNSTAALDLAETLDFADQQLARETLEALRPRQNVVSAALYTVSGAVLATYHRDGMSQGSTIPPPQPDGYHFRVRANSLAVFQKILHAGEPVGTIYLQSDLQAMYDRLKRYGLLGALALLMSMGVSFLLAVRLQRVISLPILHLAQTAKDVSEKRDYTVRAVRYHKDEVGLLIDSFNEMLTQIQERDVALLASNQALTEQQNLLLQELTEAADYVTSLLPPQLTGAVQATWKFLPSARLGGDAFGYHWLNAEQFAIYLLDVCGHGVGAALLSVAVMDALRSHTLPDTDFCNPAAVLRALNMAFPMEEHGEMFFTIWYGVYNQSTQQIVYANGGHPPPILVTDAPTHPEKVIQLKAPGVVLGAMPDLQYVNACCDIKVRSKLYLFSDGAFEVTRTDGTFLTFTEFVALLARPSLSGMADLDRLFQDVQTLHGSQTFDDDLSMIQIVLDPGLERGPC